MAGSSNVFRFEKTKRINKLSKKDQEDLVFDLVYAVVQAQSVADVALFLQDLLTKKEIETLSKRLRIAKLLIGGSSYEEIKEKLFVSHGTVAKIAAWLSERGEGFRKIIQKIPKQKSEKSWEEFTDWDRIKRRYSIYFWPELLLEEIIKNSNKRQKERIREVLDRVKEKSDLHRKIEKLL